jgi:uncharacterized membrane protein (DUF485 family)
MEETYEKIASSSEFEQLVRKRNRFAFTLSAIILVIYYAFVIFASTSGATFATPIAEGSKIVIGLLIGWGIQIFAFLMTGVYVARANSEYDGMTRNVIQEVGR